MMQVAACTAILTSVADCSDLLHTAALPDCRQYAEEHHIDPELRKLLPRDEGKPIEKPAERALRERM